MSTCESSVATSLCLYPLLGLHPCSTSVDECQWMLSLLHTGIQFYTFSSYTLPCQTPFCQTAPLLPSVTQQQNVAEHWWEISSSTAIPPTPSSDIMGQQNKIGGIAFRAALALRHLPPLETGTLISKMKQDLIITRVRIFLLCYVFNNIKNYSCC